MRPVRRGSCPQSKDFKNYVDARPELVSRLGSYCSYCERRIQTGLEVEHIQPKGISAYAGLIGRWENFLLACRNCNATKKDKDVRPEDVLLPDRDNTFVAFEYRPDGAVAASADLTEDQAKQARATLALVGLDKKPAEILDANGKAVALDRYSQRRQAWLIAQSALDDYLHDPLNPRMRRQIIELAKAEGFFSILMNVFQKEPAMLQDLIDAFSGTRDSGCFDSLTAKAVSPAPNPDGLAAGSKV